MGIHFVDIFATAPASPAPTEVELLRDEVKRLKAKRAYDMRQMRHIRRILRAIDFPTRTQGTINRNAIASPCWQVLLLAKTAIALCRERDATRDLISAVDQLMDYRRHNRANWQPEKADDYFRLIEAARERIIGDDEADTIAIENFSLNSPEIPEGSVATDGAEPITNLVISQDPAWRQIKSSEACAISIYHHIGAPLAIDFGDEARWPGVPYLTNGIETVELPGLATMALLNAFVAGFNRRK